MAHFETIDASIFLINKILNNIFYLYVKYCLVILGQPVYIHITCKHIYGY